MNAIKIVFRLIFTMIVLLPGAALAQDARSVDVRFPRGASGTTINGSVSGYQSVNYRIGVSAGQRMSVQLDTSNASNYFNITGPGASQALFNSSISGNSTSVVIPSSGNYVVSVYLMRNAARRNETASYQLSLYVEGAAAAAPRPTPPAPDFADGLQGGPDYWQVQGLAGGDTLNVRSGPSTGNAVIGTVRNGDVLQNFGCTMSGSTRWCQVRMPNGSRGWVAGRYLHESFGASPRPTPRPTPLPVPIPSSPPANGVSTSQMPRFCAGEASAEYGVRPQDITTNMAFRSGNQYVSQGSFDNDNDSSTFFNCWFNLDGSFDRVD
ncbi:MAG: hypothetical protein JWP26_1065 [Devosia sp.]|uniref:SH3 domain-containing protein n=1 Tax=Devosia sp. TaxID=1871048 RepID=UPI00260F1BEE|nr:SH3 domain-containing protein [Devosia sp.]MDB5586095.1 hypothetical protein [Devosia sp.]